MSAGQHSYFGSAPTYATTSRALQSVARPFSVNRRSVQLYATAVTWWLVYATRLPVTAPSYAVDRRGPPGRSCCVASKHLIPTPVGDSASRLLTLNLVSNSFQFFLVLRSNGTIFLLKIKKIISLSLSTDVFVLANGLDEN